MSGSRVAKLRQAFIARHGRAPQPSQYGTRRRKWFRVLTVIATSEWRRVKRAYQASRRVGACENSRGKKAA